MTLRDGLVVAADVQLRLGQALDEVLASLWPVDCQSCNRPLRGGGVALSVDDMLAFASASLHHDKCRPSSWNDNGIVKMTSSAALTHRMASILLPLRIGDATEPVLKPFLVVNPGLEQINLVPGAGKTWEVVPNAGFTDAGLKPPPVVMDSPVTGVSAVLRGNTLSAVFHNKLLGPYDIALVKQAQDLVKRDGGLMLVITHAVDPHAVTRDVDLQPVMQGDRTVMGWIGLNAR